MMTDILTVMNGMHALILVFSSYSLLASLSIENENKIEIEIEIDLVWWWCD